MAFNLFSLIEAFLLLVNAITILDEQRFLDKINWGRNQNRNVGFNSMAPNHFGQPDQPSLKQNLIFLIHSVRTVMRPPLILLNIIVILIKLVAG